MEKIDGKDAGSNGRTSHAYVLPGEHEWQVHYIQYMATTCAAARYVMPSSTSLISLKRPRSLVTPMVRYVNDEKGSVVLDDRGEHYDTVCLKARTHIDGQNC